MNLLSDLFGQKFFTNTSSRLLCTMYILSTHVWLLMFVMYLAEKKYEDQPLKE